MTSSPTVRTKQPGRFRLALSRLKQQTLRFKIGICLLILYPLMYLIIPISPLLPIGSGLKVAIIGGVLAAAEAVLLIAIACIGKEAYQSIKARLRPRKRGTASAAPPERPSTASGADV